MTKRPTRPRSGTPVAIRSWYDHPFQFLLHILLICHRTIKVLSTFRNFRLYAVVRLVDARQGMMGATVKRSLRLRRTSLRLRRTSPTLLKMPLRLRLRTANPLLNLNIQRPLHRVQPRLLLAPHLPILTAVAAAAAAGGTVPSPECMSSPFLFLLITNCVVLVPLTTNRVTSKVLVEQLFQIVTSSSPWVSVL